MLKEFNTSGLRINGEVVWVMKYAGRSYGPYFHEPDAINAAHEILELNDAHLSNRAFFAEIYQYWVKTARQYSIVMDNAPQFTKIENEHDTQKWADDRFFKGHS